VPVHIVNHPLVHDALMQLRDVRTQPSAFRRAAERISVLLAAGGVERRTIAAAYGRNTAGPCGRE
jgi:uracil phosphoribosyltransferase